MSQKALMLLFLPGEGQTQQDFPIPREEYLLPLILPDIYPPFTPMNCRFFFVEGDPGSPSAFRFMIERRDCGDDAAKDLKGSQFTVTHTAKKRNDKTVCG